MLLSEIKWEDGSVFTNLSMHGACIIKCSLDLVINQLISEQESSDEYSSAIDVLEHMRFHAKELEKTLDRLGEELFYALESEKSEKDVELEYTKLKRTELMRLKTKEVAFLKKKLAELEDEPLTLQVMKEVRSIR